MTSRRKKVYEKQKENSNNYSNHWYRTGDYRWNRILYMLSIIGQGLNIFDLFIVDLLWWRNTKRVRLRKMPEKELYQNPKKHIEAFIRAFIMYLLIALIDGYILTLL